MALTTSSPFVTALEKCGIYIMSQRGDAGLPNTTRTGGVAAAGGIFIDDHSRCVRKLESHLRLHAATVTQFTDDLFRHLMAEEMLLIRMMNPLESSTRNTVELSSISGHFGHFDSFLKLLLRVEMIQTSVIASLLQVMIAKLSGAAADEETVAISVKIFNHIRWCDIIFRPDDVIRAILEAIPNFPREMKIESISTLPSLIYDHGRDALVVELLEMLDASPDLIACIFDTISNLNLSVHSDALMLATDKAVELMSSAGHNDLPVLTRFLLDAATSSNSVEILSQLRTKLSDFINTGSHLMDSHATYEYDFWRSQSLLIAPNRRGQQTIANEIAQHFSCITLILNIIKTCFYSKQLILVGAFTQIVQGETDFETMEVIDLWIVYCLYGSSKLRSKMHTLMTRKYVNGSLTFKALLRSIKGYKSVLDNYLFGSICTIAQSLIAMSAFQGRIVAGNVATVAAITEKYTGIDGLATDYPQMIALEIYLILYAEWAKSAQRRQEIVAALVSHVSSPNLAEANAGLLILAAISECEDTTISLNGDRGSTSQTSASQVMTSDIEDVHDHGYTTNPLSAHTLRSVCKAICDVLHRSAISSRNANNSLSSGSTTLGTFAPFIKSLLDDVRSFADYQLRVLFRVVFQSSVPKHILCDSLQPTIELTNTNDSEGNHPIATGTMVSSQVQDSLPNDVMILLKKFLGSNDFKVRKIAIIAFVSFLTLIRTTRFEEVDLDETNANEPDVGSASHGQSISAGLANYLLNNLLCSLANDSRGLAFLNDEFADVIVSGMLNSSVIIERLFRSSDESLQELIGFSLDDIPPLNIYWTKLLQRKGLRPVINNSKNNSSSIDALAQSNISLSFGFNRQPNSNSRTVSSTRAGTQRGLTQFGTVTGGASDDDNVIYFRILPGVLKSEYTQPSALQHTSFASSSHSSSSSSNPRAVLGLDADENNAICIESLSCRGDSISYLTAVIRLLSACNLRISNSLAAIGVIITCPLELPSNSVLDNYEDFFHPLGTPGINGRVPHIICYSFKYSIDVLREIIGAFSRIVQDSDDKAGIVHRFNCLVEAEGILISLLQRSRDDVVEELTGSFCSNIGSYNPTISKKNPATAKVSVTKKKSVTKNGKDGNTSKKKGSGNKPFDPIIEGDEMEIHGSEDEILIPTSGNMQQSKTSASLQTETSTDLKLIVAQIELAIEPNLRPLALSAGAILGYGVSACSIPTGMVLTGTATCSTSVTAPLDDRITLSERSILRMLLHILSSCKVFERKASSLGSRSIIVQTNDLLVSPSPIAVAKCQLELPACCNLRVDVGEMEFFSHLQKYESFLALFDFLDNFSVCLSKSLDSDRIQSSPVHTNEPPREQRRRGLTSESQIGQPTRAQAATRVVTHIEPSDQISRMMLVLNIMHSVLNSKLLVDELISCASLLLSQQDDNGGIEASRGSQNSTVRRPLIVTIIANFAGNILSDVDETEDEQATSSINFVKEFESSVFMLYENLNIICCRLKEPMLLDVAIAAVRIIDRCLVLLDKLKFIIESSGDPFNNYLSLRNQSRSEIAAGICTICLNIISHDWTDSFTKRRYTSKDLGYMLETQFKYLPHENRLVMISEFATSVIPGIINDTERDPTSEGDGSNAGGLYATANKSTMVLYYSSLMKNVTDFWTTTVSDYRQHVEANGGKDYEADGSTEEALIETLRSLVESFKDLVLLSKISDVQKSLYVTTLRDGGKFVRKFVDSMNILTRLTGSEIFRSLVLKILGRLQLATRQLQHLCAHAKSVLRDNQLSKEVPAIKKLLEELIFRARDMASRIPFLQDIRISTLKHRRIDGTAMRKEDIEDEILSQAPEDSASDDGRDVGSKRRRNSQSQRTSATQSNPSSRDKRSLSRKQSQSTQLTVVKKKRGKGSDADKITASRSAAKSDDAEDVDNIGDGAAEEEEEEEQEMDYDKEGEEIDGDDEANSGEASNDSEGASDHESRRSGREKSVFIGRRTGAAIHRKSSKSTKRSKQFVIADDDEEEEEADQGDLNILFDELETPLQSKKILKSSRPSTKKTLPKSKIIDVGDEEAEFELLDNEMMNDQNESSGREDDNDDGSDDEGDDCLDSYGSEVVSDNDEVENDESDAGYPFDGDSNSD